ncbi:universal stress protein [Mesobacterium pallidum]|uniref:universal stress protein n=1 Tax=Mesobacterium pallidum TaxID=2872037 RepID=UPI001EE1A75B|nr:universal stress protein [Mesobacterium pallidum]
MYSKIMVPVDLRHVDKLGHALSVAGDLAKLWDATVTYVGVTAAAPSDLGHTPEEYAERLAAFAEGQGASLGIKAAAHAMVSHDPTTDLDPTLLRAVEETGADLVIMASHLPNIADRLWPSNGGTVATRATASVMIVRG